MQSSPSCGRSQRRQPGNGENKRELNSKIHLAVDAHGMPVKVIVTAGTTTVFIISWFRTLGAKGIFFVTRLKRNAVYKLLERHPVNRKKRSLNISRCT
jgi:hypothetical protein